VFPQHFSFSQTSTRAKYFLLFRSSVGRKNSVSQGIGQRKNSKDENKKIIPQKLPNPPPSDYCVGFIITEDHSIDHDSDVVALVGMEKRLICDQQLASQQKPGKPNENNTSDHVMERRHGRVVQSPIKLTQD